MYLEHFGFLEEPFGATPDPKLLYFSREHAEALAALHYGLVERRGFLVLTGRPGMGKTTILRYLLQRWKDRAATAFVFHPPETREQMIAAVLEDLELTAGGSYAEGRRLLEALAVECCRQGKRLLLIFDEAQAIPPAVLEEIRLLSNLETPEEKLVEIILAGQPALLEKLQAPECEQLRQRVSIWARLLELDEEEVRRYVEQRLRLAGGRKRLFTGRALSRLARASQGIPRTINALCFQALSEAFAEGKKKVDEGLLRRAAPETAGRLTGARRARIERPGWVAAAATAGMAAGTLVASTYLQHYTLAGVASSLPLRAVKVSAAPPPSAPLPARVVASGTSPLPAPGAPAEGRRPPEVGRPEILRAAPVDLTGSSGPPEPPSQPRSAARERIQWVRVARSETLRRIALRHYGRWNAEVWEQIRQSNPWLTDPDKLRAGEVLALPSRRPVTRRGESQP